MCNWQKVMQQVAIDELERSKGKLYEYNIIDGLCIGICEIQHISYNPLFKTFDMVLKDINTYNVMYIDRCNVKLKRRA